MFFGKTKTKKVDKDLLSELEKKNKSDEEGKQQPDYGDQK